VNILFQRRFLIVYVASHIVRAISSMRISGFPSIRWTVSAKPAGAMAHCWALTASMATGWAVTVKVM